MNHEGMDQLLKHAESLHSSPHVAQKVVHVVRDDDFDIVDVVKLLECDPALSVAILRLVNSSHYGLRNKVDGLRQAVALIGRRSLRRAVLSFGIIDRLTSGMPAEVYLDFWRRAFTTAAIASRLLPDGDRKLSDQAYTSGLLADLGVLLFMQVEQEKYLPLSKDFPHGRQLVQAEVMTFGFDHATLGAELMKRWGFGDDITNAICDHHGLSGSAGSLTRLLQAADTVNDFIWYPASSKVAECHQLLRHEYRLDMDAFISLVVEMKELISQSEDIFGVKVLAEVDPEAIRQLANHLYQSQEQSAGVAAGSQVPVEAGV
jgi:HD-like signal output (HDOD) protein